MDIDEVLIFICMLTLNISSVVYVMNRIEQM